jgi:hypothetical protein
VIDAGLLAVCLVMKEAGSLTGFLWVGIVAGLLAVCLEMKEAGSLTSFLWVGIDAGNIDGLFSDEEGWIIDGFFVGCDSCRLIGGLFW